MVIARVAEYLSPSDPQPEETATHIGHDGRNRRDAVPQNVRQIPVGRAQESLRQDTPSRPAAAAAAPVADVPHESYRPPYLHAMLAGGLGGTMGDMLMHSLDTVKTRQQGDPHMPPKYTSMGNTYYTIFRQEGLWRGLYGGVTPAFVGSFTGTTIFFLSYEWSKRLMIDHGVAPWLAYLAAGFGADLAASPMYVPTEVLKTRLQLQGRYNNPFFASGYNYRSTMHAARTIYRTEGLGELLSGYKATLFRDLPFSALQFAFYEQEQKWAKRWVGPGEEIGLGLEILTGASAGGMAGVLTCPMDVVKTRIQTELDPQLAAAAKKAGAAMTATTTTTGSKGSGGVAAVQTPPVRPSTGPATTTSASQTSRQSRPISTSGPSTQLKHHGQVSLGTESVLKALRIIYRSEGITGWFRGVGPRFVWTSVQSGTMLLVYQRLLKWFDANPLVGTEGIDGL